jgi:hypothetical protein
MPHRFKAVYIRNAILTFFTMLYLVYPTITSYTLGIINCSTIDGVSYLRRDFSIVCWTKQHMYLIFGFGIPIALVWIVGYPLFVFIILKKNIKNIDSTDMVIKYGTFYIGLKNEAFYWEIIIINIRKVILSVIIVSLSA